MMKLRKSLNGNFSVANVGISAISASICDTKQLNMFIACGQLR